MSKELHDLLTEMVKLYQERQCFLAVHAERLCALLPAAPAAPTPLTDEQIKEAWEAHRAALPRYLCFARAIERAHGIGKEKA
jgi:hypothetical protein